MSNDNPFIAGFQTGIELQRARSEMEYKQGLLSRMQKENELRDYELQKTKASDKAPEDFLRSLSTTREGEVAAPVPSESEAASIVSGSVEKSPKDILSEYTALPETQQVPLSAEDRLVNLATFAAKYPEKKDILTFLALKDPVLGPEMKLQALREKMAEKNLELGFKQKEKTFDTDQDIRKETVKAGNEMNKMVAGKAIDYQSKINEKKVVLVSEPNNPEIKLPYDTNANQPMALVKPIDPADPKKGSMLVPNPAYNKQGDSWKLTPETAKAIIKTNPDVVTSSKSGNLPKTEQEFDTLAKYIASDPSYAAEVMKRYQQKFIPGGPGGQAAGQGAPGVPAVQTPVSGKASPAQQVQAPSGGLGGTVLGAARSAGAFLEGLLPVTNKGQAGSQPATSPSPTVLAGGEKPMDPVTRVVTGRDVKDALISVPNRIGNVVTVDQGNVQGRPGKMSLEELANSQTRPGSNQPQKSEAPKDKLEKASGIFFKLTRGSTTSEKARAVLEKAFPELSEKEINKILDPVTHKAEVGSGVYDMVDLEKLRDNIDSLYSQARENVKSQNMRALPKP